MSTTAVRTSSGRSSWRARGLARARRSSAVAGGWRGGGGPRNPHGRDFGFARRIELGEAGRRHPMFTGKPAVFEAITVHRDDIESLPAHSVALANNDMGLQALELRHGRGIFWGVQYHP